MDSLLLRMYNVGYILKTTNGGNDWSIKDTCNHEGGLKSIFFADELNGYAVGGVQEGGSSLFGYLFKTTNGGEDWIDTNFYFYQPGFADVYFIDLNTGYIVGQYGLILKTTDAGETWFEQYSGTTHLPSILFIFHQLIPDILSETAESFSKPPMEAADLWV